MGKEDRCFQKLLRGRSANADRVGSSDHMIGDVGIFSHCSVIDIELFSPSNPHFAASPSRPQPTLIPPFRPYIRFRQPLVPPPPNIRHNNAARLDKSVGGLAPHGGRPRPVYTAAPIRTQGWLRSSKPANGPWLTPPDRTSSSAWMLGHLCWPVSTLLQRRLPPRSAPRAGMS